MGNLLRNACHYTEHGFIRLTLNDNGFVVEDSGVGIPEKSAKPCSSPSCVAMKSAVKAWAGLVAGAANL
jgi:hypothetical protein